MDITSFSLFSVVLWLAFGWVAFKTTSYVLYRARYAVWAAICVGALVSLMLRPQNAAAGGVAIALVILWVAYLERRLDGGSRDRLIIVSTVVWWLSLIGSNWTQDSASELWGGSLCVLAAMVISKSPIRSAEEKAFWANLAGAVGEGMANAGTASLVSSPFKDREGNSTTTSTVVYFGTLHYLNETRPFAAEPAYPHHFEQVDRAPWEVTWRHRWMKPICAVLLAPVWLMALPFLGLGMFGAGLFKLRLKFANSSQSIGEASSSGFSFLTGAPSFVARESIALAEYVLSQPLLRYSMEAMGMALFWDERKNFEGPFIRACRTSMAKTRPQLC